MHTEADGLTIFYTLDGTEPTDRSKRYTGPFTIKQSATLKARAFLDDEPEGDISARDFSVHLAAGMPVVGVSASDKTEWNKLSDLNYGKLNSGDAAWQAIPGDLDVEVHFNAPTTVSAVKFTTLRFTIARIYPPWKTEVYGSENGVDFTKLGAVSQMDQSHEQGRNKVETSVTFEPVRIKVLKLKAHSVNPIPDGHHAAGAKSRIFIDEIIVN
jgi:hexosaminidase